MPSDARPVSPHAALISRLQEAVRRHPEDAAGHSELSQMLEQAGQLGGAVESARRAAQLQPGNDEFAVQLALLLDSNGQSDGAWDIVDRLIATGARGSRLCLLYSRLAPRHNRADEALGMIVRLLHNSPIMLAREQTSLLFAASHLLDSLSRYDEAFDYAARANHLRGVRYDAALSERLVDDFSSYFTQSTLRRLPRATSGGQKPVFIIGMPRSGTTLVEQILASHPEVHAVGEVDWIYRAWASAVERHGSPIAPLAHVMDRLSVNDADELAAEYLQLLESPRPDASRVVDKMHTNFLHLGLIQVLFPQAHIVHCRRTPLDACLSCVMTDFASGNHFSADLSWCGHFYRQYERMMSHWKSTLEMPILEVDYERVVDDLEGQSRRLVEFIGLEWNANCLHFHENRRPVATASMMQVRQPIYRGSVGRWRKYDKHLGPLHTALDGG